MLKAELAASDAALGRKPQVVVLNKGDIIAVCEREEELLVRRRRRNVWELMGRLQKIVDAEKRPSSDSARSSRPSTSPTSEGTGHAA